jgi:hypothetical protein
MLILVVCSTMPSVSRIICSLLVGWQRLKWKMSAWLIRWTHTMKRYGGGRDVAPTFLTLAPDLCEWSTSGPNRFIPWKKSHEGVWGSGYIDPHFLVLGTSWSWVVSFRPRPLYPRGPLDRLGGLWSRSERRGKQKILTLPGLELRPFGRPARS